jgi:hypothetical protein
MTARPLSHPSPDTLRALADGQLDDVAAKAVLAHLAACPDCCRTMSTLGGADFLRRLCAAETAAGVGTLGAGAAAAAPEAMPPELRDHAEFEVLRKLGGGGMGVVYLARDRLTHRQEVLKVVNPYLATRPGVADRFLREIRAVVQLLHPNIVTAYGALQLGGLLVLKMEYVPGDDLSAVVKSSGPLPVVNACYYAQHVAVGLQFAFGKGMVHRDIKPANLMLVREGKKHTVKILDFGLVKAIGAQGGEGDQLTGTAQGMGTPSFMAPEQAKDATRADTRADVYSLGCTLYFLLTGRPPFAGLSAYDLWEAHRSKEAAPLNEVRKDVPPELAAVVAKMLAKAPDQRYQQPLEVAHALKPFVKVVATPPAATPARQQPGEAPPAPTADEAEEKKGRPVAAAVKPSPGGPRQRWGGGRSKLGVIAAAVGVVAAVAVAAVLVLTGGSLFGRRPEGPTVREETRKSEPEGPQLELVKEPGSDAWGETLREPVMFPVEAFDDPKLTVGEALDWLQDSVKEKTGGRFTIAVNKEAIHSDLDVQDAVGKAIGGDPPRRRLATVQDFLEWVTARVHANARYRLTKDGVELTSVFELPVSTRRPVKGVPFRQALDSIEDQFRVTIESDAVKDRESRLITMPATSNVRLRVLLERILRQVDARIGYPVTDPISLQPALSPPPDGGMGGLGGLAGGGGKIGFNGGQGQ